jgi:hypothetical protein
MDIHHLQARAEAVPQKPPMMALFRVLCIDFQNCVLNARLKIFPQFREQASYDFPAKALAAAEFEQACETPWDSWAAFFNVL